MGEGRARDLGTQRWLSQWKRRSVSQLKLEQMAAASSLPSPQSSVPSHRSDCDTHRLLPHWNL